jgi:carbon-monoxide dehydrogenase medium subunit
MYAFTYHRASSISHAVSLAAAGEETKYLAGGQTLVQAMKLRLASPSDLIDLSDIAELRGIAVAGGRLTIGAMTRHADVAASEAVRENLPALAALAGMIGDRQVRHMGTAGGSIAASDPAADYPGAALALGATILTDRRSIAADSFFKGLFETELEPDELVISLSFPLPRRAAYKKFRHPASRFAVVGVFVADFGDAVRVAVTGAGPCAFRQQDMEKALGARLSPEALYGIEIAPEGLNSDAHASARYRAHLVGVMARRAVASICGLEHCC